ncbi:MAG: histidine kinase [Phenylobacterium sp.]|nr:MAG: histidine kinase [Phenylobacterium sp.]
MASSARLARLAAQALVFAGGALAVLAWRAGLPANALLAAVAALALAVWLVNRAIAEASAPEPPPAEADALRLDEERARRTLQAYLDQAPTPLVTLQADGPLTAVNRAARRLFRTDGVVAEAAPELTEAIAAASPDGRRTVRLNAGGLPRTYALSVAEVVGAGGALRLAALTDIQAEIQAAEAAALKELLQVLSHEIMNSLTPLASLAQSAEELLAEGGAANTRLARDSLGVIARRTAGLQRFVTAYRKLARLPDPSPRTVSLSELLEEAARLFRTRWTGVALEVEPPNPDVRVRLDPDLTAQALINLLANAADAALAGERPPQVWLAGVSAGEGIAITVRDSGAGVAASGDIFRPFFTTKPEGSGIGLSLARQAIVSQGGQLVLAPHAEGQGATFVIEL